MEYLIFFLVSFIIIYLIYTIFVNNFLWHNKRVFVDKKMGPQMRPRKVYTLIVVRKKRALNKMKSSKDILLLCNIGKIDIEKVEFKKLVNLLALVNSLIISLVATLVLILENFVSNFYVWIILSCVVTLILLLPFILIGYKLIGKIINKKGR